MSIANFALMKQMFESLLAPEVQTFIKNNLDKTPGELLLKKQPWKGDLLKEIANQIEAKRKAKVKLPSWFMKEGIVFPPILSMEQCSSELTANYKTQLLRGKTLIDLTGGFGVDDFAFKQVFDTVHYVEMNEILAKVVAHNAQVFGLSGFEVHATTAEQFLESFLDNTDAFYIDPARRDINKNKVFRFADCVPDIVTLQESLLQQAPSVLVKASPLMDLKQGLSELKYVAEIHVVAVQNECKEVLFLLKRDYAGQPVVKTVNLASDNQAFEFTLEEEENSIAHFSEPLVYLYEPNAAILKAGAFKVLGKKLGLKKLHSNTHLYTSDLLIKEFPGRVFEIKEVLKIDRKQLAVYLPAMKANLTIRNFPSSTEDLRKKLGLQNGGDDYLFACETVSGKVLLCTKKAVH